MNKVLYIILFCSFGVFLQGQHIDVWVNGTCGMCKDQIEKNALILSGVKEADWSIATKVMHIVHDNNFNIDDLHTQMAAIGHDTKEVFASDESYGQLAECCRYRTIDLNTHDIDLAESQIHTTGVQKAIKSFNEDVDETYVHGVVFERGVSEVGDAMVGAMIYWQNGTSSAQSDSDGYFKIKKPKNTDNLIVQFVGYHTDTIQVQGSGIIQLQMTNEALEVVNIVYRRKSTEVSFINNIKVTEIGGEELLKAACCNLSESFETTPAVDVATTDAVSGTKKIELLGLAGPNIQMMRENIPMLRGIAAVSGLTYTPGPWIEGIQLVTGIGSVTSSPESLTGQINVELHKPSCGDKLVAEVYANEFQRFESNLVTRKIINDKWSTGVSLHASQNQWKHDHNRDGFNDGPLNKLFMGLNRWKYVGTDGLRFQWGIKGLTQGRESGQLLKQVEQPWKANLKANRLESWMKLGKVFKNPAQSIGLQVSVTSHDEASAYGKRAYTAKQKSLYSNLVYEHKVFDDKIIMKVGANAILDRIDEDVTIAELRSYKRKENLLGLYTEMDYKLSEQFRLQLGLRSDFHNSHGLFFSPRLHLKYSPTETLAIRLLGGRGQRTASIFAENIAMFASNRKVFIEQDFTNNTPYGLGPEVAWNAGVNLTKSLDLFGRNMILTGDYYYTDFESQVIFDYDVSATALHIYNLKGQSTAHSVHAQMDYELFKNFDLRVAYRYNQVEQDFKTGRKQKPLSSYHRFFVNFGWEFIKDFHWDLTFNYHGSKRIPFTADNPVEYQLDQFSPSHYMINTQFAYFFKNGFEVYLGAQNILSYRQDDSIISPARPYSPYFDASLVWGPLMGRNIYGGMRYRIGG